MEEVVTTSMESVISTVNTIFTAAIGWVGDVATTISGEPLLLMFCSLPLIGIGVGMFKRLINVN